MDEWDEKTAEHEADAIDEALAELEALSQRRIALEAVEEMMD
jgi:hypothetical protein